MTTSNSTPNFSYSQPMLPMFDGEHYDYWSSQMQTFFISQDLWELVEEGYDDLPENSTDVQQKLYSLQSSLLVPFDFFTHVEATF